MDHLAQLREKGFQTGVVERLGVAKRVLDGNNAASELWQLFNSVPLPDLNELFGILLQFYVPDRHNLLAFLEHKALGDTLAPPSQAQLGFLRDNVLWTSPADCERDDLWNYLLFRWSIQYFEKTIDLMVKSLGLIDQLPQELSSLLALDTPDLFVVSIVAHHDSLLLALAPRVVKMLQHPQFCRDVVEHNELSTLTRYVLASPAVSISIKTQISFEYFFNIAAGNHAHLQALPLRQEAMLTVAAASNVLLQTWIRNVTNVNIVNWLCHVLVDLSAEVHYIAVAALSFYNFNSNTQWPTTKPYLYELAIHVLLSANRSQVMYSLQALLASQICQGFSLAFPRRNIIEGCFYAFTDVLQNVPRENCFRHSIEENLRGALSTVGNRATFVKLVSWQDTDTQLQWGYLFPLLTWPTESIENVISDSVTEQPIFRPWFFPGSQNHETRVGLETILRQVAFNGLRNPFTNIVFLWENFFEVNQHNQ